MNSFRIHINDNILKALGISVIHNNLNAKNASPFLVQSTHSIIPSHPINTSPA